MFQDLNSSQSLERIASLVLLLSVLLGSFIYEAEDVYVWENGYEIWKIYNIVNIIYRDFVSLEKYKQLAWVGNHRL